MSHDLTSYPGSQLFSNLESSTHNPYLRVVKIKFSGKSNILIIFNCAFTSEKTAKLQRQSRDGLRGFG